MPASRGLQPKKCQYCERKFSKVDHLKRHERSHTGERPYACPQCNKKFSRSDVLIRHQKCHPHVGKLQDTEKSSPESDFIDGKARARRRTNSSARQSWAAPPINPQQSFPEPQKQLPPVSFASLIDPALQDQFPNRTPFYMSPYSIQPPRANAPTDPKRTDGFMDGMAKQESEGNANLDPSMFGRSWDRGMSTSPFVQRDDGDGFGGPAMKFEGSEGVPYGENRG